MVLKRPAHKSYWHFTACYPYKVPTTFCVAAAAAAAAFSHHRVHSQRVVVPAPPQLIEVSILEALPNQLNWFFLFG